MPCTGVRLPDGGSAIVCTGGRRGRQPRCACGAVAPLLCDWKVGAGLTCDTPICSSCAVAPAEGKDLCPDHGRAWEAWKAARGCSDSSP